MERAMKLNFFERIKARFTRAPESFTERPKAQIASKRTGRTRTARIGRHKRVQVGLVDLANVCPTCGGNPIRSMTNGHPGSRLTFYTCANQHTWAD